MECFYHKTLHVSTKLISPEQASIKGSSVQIVCEVPDLDEAVRLASLGFVKPVSPELINDVSNHLNGDLILSFVEGNNLVGFSIFASYDELLYLYGIMIDPIVQGKAYAAAAISFAKAKFDARYLALSTQNPRMWAVGQRNCSVWLPNPEQHQPDDELQEVIVKLEKLRQLPHPVSVGCYSSPLYGEKPCHRNDTLQRWWDELCDYERGDAVVCVGKLK